MDETGGADLHSHLVPGVDDGARTVDDVVEGVRRMVGEGTGRIVTTPHLEASLTSTPGALDARLGEVSQAWGKASGAVSEAVPDVEFRLGFEVMLDIPDPDFGDSRVRLAGTRFVLVEWPRMRVPPGTVEVVRRLREEGWWPVIAHPERYAGMGDDFELAGAWRRAGACLQVNYGSLVGRYGPVPRSLAYRFLRQGWADCMSTDFHGRPHLHLHRRDAIERLEALGGVEQARLLTSVNTNRILDDEAPLPVPPLPADRGIWGRIRELLHIDLD